MKKTFLFVSLIFVCFNLFAQSEKLRVGILNGPTCVPAAYLIDKNAAKQHKKKNIQTDADSQLLP